ncbi:MAG: hypothetical protein EOP84_24250 [Verrucomicrobiaceae bacterium]|nr:MAG: hypothetical protein EOP84_24250 [Verrucomicrobiaceae bacterium]
MSKAPSLRKPKPKRQPNGEGTPSVLPSGLIRYTGTWNNRRVSGSAKKTYEEAKASYRQKIRDLECPPPSAPEPEPEMPTVAEYMLRVLDGPWRSRLSHKTMAPSTWLLAEQILRLNVTGSELGAKPLGKVFPADLERWAAALITLPRVTKTRTIPSRSMANTTKRRYLVTLGSVFEHARKQDKLIAADPFLDVVKLAKDKVGFRARSIAELMCHSTEVLLTHYVRCNCAVKLASTKRIEYSRSLLKWRRAFKRTKTKSTEGTSLDKHRWLNSDIKQPLSSGNAIYLDRIVHSSMPSMIPSGVLVHR